MKTRSKDSLKPRKRGIALATVMIMLAVLTMMTVGFFQVYRSHFALSRSTLSTQAAGGACEAVYEYVVFRVEHDKSWGAVPFPDAGDSGLASTELTLSTVPDTHVFEGRIESLGATFTATIYNNINGGGSAEVAAKARAGTVYCSVSAVCNDATRRAEFLLDRAPLFDSSVLTRADLKVDAMSLRIRSTDPDRNMLRAEGDIIVPDMLNGSHTQFLTDAGLPDPRGLLWAKDGIYSEDEEVDTEEEMADARQNSNGKIVPHAESHFSIFDIDEQNLQLPDDATVVSLEDDPLARNGGRWTFVRRQAEVTYEAEYTKDTLFGESTKDGGGTKEFWVDVLEFYKNPDDTTPSAVYRGEKRTSDIISSIPAEVDGFLGDFELDASSIRVTNFAIPAYEGLGVPSEVVPGDAKTYGDAGEIRFDLTNQKVTINKDATVVVKGPFQVTSESDEAAPEETPPPVLDLGYEENSSAVGGVSKATLIADGTINIERGVTQGLGRLISKRGDVRIQPENTASVTVDAGDSTDGSGLLVYAGQDVHLSNPDGTEDWNFRGLVYARQGIKMDGGGVGNARFEGTIVALQDNPPNEPGDPNGIEFLNCDDVEFIYNPDLFEGYLNALPNDRIQVQSVYWKR